MDLALPTRVRQIPRLAGHGKALLGDWLGAPGAGPVARAEALQRFSQMIVSTHRVAIELDGQFPSGPKIIVSNHLGYVDPVVISSLVPVSPIAKLEVASWPFLGKVGRRYRVNFVSRADPQSGARSLWRAWRTLEAGGSVLNFPEGTTSIDEVLPFKRGIFGLAQLVGVPVVPVAIKLTDPAVAWVGEQLFITHYAKTATTGPHQVKVVVGEPLNPADFHASEALAECARRWIAENSSAKLSFSGD